LTHWVGNSFYHGVKLKPNNVTMIKIKANKGYIASHYLSIGTIKLTLNNFPCMSVDMNQPNVSIRN